jgi:hypothetical protein
VFPQLEFKRSVVGNASVQEVRLDRAGLRVVAEQGLGVAENPVGAATVFYDFSPDLQPVEVSFSDQYIALHRHWEGLHRVDHALGEGELTEAQAVLSWDGHRFQPVAWPAAR